MITVNKQDTSQTKISIQDEMTIYNVLQQKDNIIMHLQTEHALQIDLSEVTEIDSAGIQLLILLKNEASRKKNELSFIHHSQAVIDIVETFNLSSYFNDPVVLSAE